MSEGGEKRALKVLYQFICQPLWTYLSLIERESSEGTVWSRDFKKGDGGVWGEAKAGGSCHLVWLRETEARK